MTREELKAAAIAMLDRAYCPYSHFAVGAALECADGTVQRVYEISDADKAKVLANLFPFAGGPGIDDVMFDLHERKTFKVRDFIVIRWGEGNLVASPYFPRSGGMMVDWIPPRESQCNGMHRGREGGA